MNSDRAIRSFELLNVSGARELSFYAPKIYGEPWDQSPWPSSVEGSSLAWKGPTAEDNPNGNAIRWGTTYSFSFVADAGPGVGSAKVVKFKPGDAGQANELTFDIVAPVQ
ncbi:hypothetical protein [Mesorhizobium sp. LNJC403B00]|uniref:hypothetical protein n=1 Tax=Mesorhizobium sp. LNJC403B00 TaxID=1287280 RepID=UPI0012ECA2E0|nr:hypothetical protein [Mesorhizobium sp. LNJC403B00]